MVRISSSRRGIHRLAAFGARRTAKMFVVAFREMRGGFVSARHGDGQDRHARLLQQIAGPFQPDQLVMLGRRMPEILSEQALELSGRELGSSGKVFTAQRLFDRSFHQRDDGEQLGMSDAEARSQVHALLLAGFPDPMVNELIRYLSRNPMPVI